MQAFKKICDYLSLKSPTKLRRKIDTFVIFAGGTAEPSVLASPAANTGPRNGTE
jgi:hypothetical protein